MTYDIIDHYDVWGNEEDGWEVNDSMHKGTVVIPDNADKEQVIQALQAENIFSNLASLRTVVIVWVDQCIQLDEASTGKPLLTLKPLEV